MERRQFLIVFLLLAISVFGGSAFAGTSTADRQTVFNNITDYLACFGKDEEEKKDILKDRREMRRDVRLKNEGRRKQAQIRKRMKSQEGIIMRKLRSQGH